MSRTNIPDKRVNQFHPGQVWETSLFVAEFPRAPAVTLPEGEFLDMAVYLARVEPVLRREILKRWAGIIRSKAGM